jgi:hypothetical protein
MRDFWTFIKDVGSDWSGQLMGTFGILCTAIAASGQFGSRVQNALFWIGASALLVVAMYRAWLREHRLRLSAESETATVGDLTIRLAKLQPRRLSADS